jgi:hypothetical protein
VLKCFDIIVINHATSVYHLFQGGACVKKRDPMNQMLKQAIVATRAGNSKEAQILLTNVLKNDPNDVQAWYLLSLLVDSESKQIAYLQKVLSLDPNHAKAQEQLAYLQGESVLELVELSANESESPLSEPSFEDEESHLPDWLSSGLMEAESQGVMETAVSPQDDALPDWLKENLTPTWVEEQPTLISESKEEGELELPSTHQATETSKKSIQKKPAAKPIPPSAKKAEQTKPYGTLLIILIIGALITFIFLLYLIFS